LPTRTWEVLFIVVGFLSILALIAAALLWRRRERRAQHPAVQKGELGWTSVFLSVVAIGFACAAAYGRWEAVEGDGSGNLTIASLCNIASLGVVVALALVIGNLLCFREGGITRVFRGVFRRQRMNILIVLLLTVALLIIGDTSGQSVDSIRSWSPYVVGSDDPQSGAGAARLTLGLAAALLFALALYESGERLTYSKAAMATARRGLLAVVAGIVTVLGAVVFFATDEHARGRESPFDGDAVRRLGLEGVATGKRALLAALAEGSEQFRAMHDLLVEQDEQTALGEIQIDRAD
jgi:hypothetical protein